MTPPLRFLQMLIVGWLALGLPGALAQSGSAAGDLYFDGFQSWKAGEKLEQEGNKQAALQKYLEAHKAISSVAQNFPEWQPEVVSYRLKNVEQALGRLGYTVPAAPVPAAPGGLPLAPIPTTPTTPGLTPIPTTPQAMPQGGVSSITNLIDQQFQALQQQNAAKDAQLKELNNKLGMYEAGYLKSLEDRKTSDQALGLLKQQSQELSTKMEALTRHAAAKDAAAQAEMKKLRDESKMVADMMASKEKQFTESSKAIESLQKERDSLRGDVTRLQDELAKAKRDTVKPDEMVKLLADNTRMKQELEVARKQVESLKAESVKKDADLAKKDGEITALKTQLTGIQSEIAKLRQENTTYQTQVADLTVKLKEMNRELDKPAADSRGDSKLVQENQTLRTIIMRHLRQQERLRQSKELVLAEMKKMENASKSLMENLEDMTAGKVRITVDEEALFSEPELKEILAANGVSATLEATSTSTKSSREEVRRAAVVAGSNGISVEEKLMVQADAALQNQDFRLAEQSLQDALRANPKNSAALVSLAGIKLSEHKHDEAEVLLQKCLIYEPDNAAALYRLGVCYFQQSKLPDAQSTFEKAVLRQKGNARAHHYLGIIANRMSNRPRAEAEFKSALAIDPNYGDAHFNLAVLYATGNPPDMGKAREHYRNALQHGINPDPALEKMLNNAGAPALKLTDKTAAR